MQFFPTPGTDKQVLEGAVLLLPAVTAGNVGELAVDVMISSLGSNVALVGRLEEESCLPCAGADPYTMQQPGTLATGLELYQIKGTMVLILQQRAPPRKGAQQVFAQRLAAWLRQSGVQQCCVLCGLDDSMLLKDQQIMSVPFRYWRAGAAEGHDDATCSGLGWQCLEADLLKEEKEVHGLLPPWPLLDHLCTAPLPALLLCSFVSEGDNRQDALQLAARALHWLQAASHLGGAGGTAAAALGLTSPAAGGAAGAAGGAGAMEEEVPMTLRLSTPCSWAAVYGRA